MVSNTFPSFYIYCNLSLSFGYSTHNTLQFIFYMVHGVVLYGYTHIGIHALLFS
jgi:hypothetical protein